MEITNPLTTIMAEVEGWLEAFIANIPNFVAAVVILVAFWALAKGVRRGVRRVLRSASDHVALNRLLATLTYVGVLGLGLFIALGVLNLDKTVTSLLAGAGIVGLALGFAFQDTAENFISGVLLSVRKPFAVGQIVETNGYMGKVEEVNLRNTTIRTFTGQKVLVPNSDVFQSPLVNYSDLGSRRVDLAVGVSYGDDLEKARRVALEAIRGLEGRDESRDPQLYYQEFGGSSINFQVRFWIPFREQTDYLEARSRAVMRIRNAFDAADVSIPFPIRTLDFSRVGGRPLQVEIGEALPSFAGDGAEA